MSETKHTPGPWKARHVPFRFDGDTYCIDWSDAQEEVAEIVHGEANARLIARAPDMDDQIYALTTLGWTVEKTSLYDEEGVEGWRWLKRNGTEHVEMGDWNEPPPWPKSAREAVAKARKAGK